MPGASVKEYALSYLQHGFSVIPIKSRQKVPDLSRWEQFSKRKPKMEEIDGWFPDGSERNIAVICGEVSGGLFVLDFDNEDIFNYVVQDSQEMARRTPLVRTSKGYHIYYRAPTDAVPKNRKFGGGKIGLDMKAEKGYVVAPPSVHPSGTQYKFLDGLKEPKLIERMSEFLEFLEAKAEEWPFVKAVLPQWKEGHRNDLTLGLSGFFRKHLQWSLERTKGIIQGICRITKDEEPQVRERAVEETYRKPLDKKECAPGQRPIAVQEWLGEELLLDLVGLLPQRDRLTAEGRVYRVNEGAITRSYYYMDQQDMLRYAIEKYRKKEESWVVSDDWLILTEPSRINALIDAAQEDPLYDFGIGDETVRANRDDLLTWLEAHGKLATPRFRREALTALQEIHRTMGLPVETKAPWVGIYLTSPTMAVMWDPVPLRSEQEYATLEIQQRTQDVDEIGTGLQALRNLIDFFEPDEVLPFIGAGISGPFWHLLKKERMMDFIFWPVAVGPHGIGKSRVTEAVSHYLYGTPKGHASDIQSPFRFAAHMDSCALPRVYGEAEHFNFDGLSDLIKQATEFLSITHRGTTAQKMKRYSAVLAPIFSCNNYSVSDINLKPRLLLVPFHGEKYPERSDRERRKAFNRNYADLKPIGKLLLERITDKLNGENGINTLKAAIEDLRTRLEEMGIQTTDHRRLYSWAILLWGVTTFDMICRELLYRPVLPKENPVEYLVEKVVKPLEEYNQEEAIEDIFAVFTGWLEVWIDRNTHVDLRTGDRTRRGENRTWKEDDDYYYVTQGIVNEFRRENRGYEMRSMRALADEIQGRFGLPLKFIYRTVRYPGDRNRAKKSVLLPKKAQATISQFTGGPEPDFKDEPEEPEEPSTEEFESWVERAMQIMRTHPKEPFKFVVKDIQKEFDIKDYALAQKVCFEAERRLEGSEGSNV